MLRVARDGTIKVGQRRATRLDVPRRVGGPYDGERALDVVPSGMPDCTLDDDGNLVPINPTVKPAPEPPDAVELERR